LIPVIVKKHEPPGLLLDRKFDRFNNYDKKIIKTVCYETPSKEQGRFSMPGHRYHGTSDRLRSPRRVALLEMDLVVNLSLAGLNVKTALDVGTGTGLFAEAFARQGIRVTGIDPNLAMIQAARNSVPPGWFQQASAEKLPFRDGAFDLVFLGHVLHETDDPLQALIETRRVTRQRIAILEWPYQEDEEGPPLQERLQPENVQALSQAAGFGAFARTTLKHMEFYRLDL
jgi:SAM-dependent methyltransferase